MVRGSSADDANHVAALGKAYQQKPSASGVPKDEFSFFIDRMIRITLDSSQRFIEYFGGFFETHAVPGEV